MDGPALSCLVCNDRGMVSTPSQGLFGPALVRIGCPACNPEPPIFPGTPVTRKPFLLLPGEKTPEDVAVNVVRGLADFYRQPENQAYLAGCVIGAGLGGGKMRPLPGILFTMVCGLIARQAYYAARDLHAIAKASGDA